MKKNIEIKNATKKEKEFKEKAEEIRIKERKIFAKGIHNYLLLYLIIFLCLIKYYKSNPSITLQILLMESGEIQIYRDEYPPCATYAPLPDEVYIDEFEVFTKVLTEYGEKEVLPDEIRKSKFTVPVFEKVDLKIKF